MITGMCMEDRVKRGSTMEDKGVLKSAFTLSVAVCFMFFLYAPVELYLTNTEEFWYDLWVLLPIMLCVFAIFTAVCMGGFYLLYRCSMRLYQAAVLFLFVVFVCSYVQGNYLIKYLPVLDGNRVDWSLYTKGRIQSIVLWIAVVLLVAILVRFLTMKRTYVLIRVVSICMLLMFAVTLTTLCMANDGLKSKENICVTTDYEFTMSADQNFIILLMDTLDGGAFSDVVVGNEEMESVFEDFTYYDNTVSAYPHTKYNIPFLLSGMWFENGTTSDEYFEKVLTTSSFFEELEQRGYSIDLYTPDFDGFNEQTRHRFENVGMYTKKVSSYTAFARWQILLVGTKYAPHDLKRFSYVNPGAFERLKVAEEGREPFHMDNNMDFYQAVAEQPMQYREDKNFKFYHLWGAHPPYLYDGDLNYMPEGGTFPQSIALCVTMADSYLEKLKENGMYDNSVIIILGDHGQGEYYEQNNMNQHPALLIKGIGEKHEFQVNNKPVSFADMQDAYIDLLDGNGGGNVFDALPGQRERKFIWYDIKDSNHMTEYLQTGQSGDMSTMVLTGQEFNAGE